MAQSDVMVFPDSNAGNNNSGIDATTALLLGNNGGFGGMNNPFWMMFMIPFLYPFFNMFGGNGWGGFGNNNNGIGFLANQLNNDAGRDLIMQGLNNNHEALMQLATILNTDINTIQSGLNTVGTKLQEVGAQVGMSGLQVINSIQSGNAQLAAQLANCCCENRLAIANQTNALQSQMANNHAATTLEAAKNHASDQLAICQQTNALQNQAERDTTSILNAINAQTIAMNDQFCQIKERELQSKIDTQADIITQLRGQLDNDRQTAQLFAAINPLQAKVNEIASKQPNTVPVTWPNLTAVNNTPYAGGYPYGNGFGGGIIF